MSGQETRRKKKKKSWPILLNVASQNKGGHCISWTMIQIVGIRGLIDETVSWGSEKKKYVGKFNNQTLFCSVTE